MRRSTFAITVSAIALLAAAGQAAAQNATPLRVGQSVSGSLTAEDTRVDDEMMGQFIYDTYSIQATAGQRLEIAMRADGFDTYLELFEAGAPEAAIAQDDDGLGEGTNSRLRYTFAKAGTYTLRARTLGGLEGGDYTIVATDRGPAPPAPRPTPIRLGASVEGTISGNDGTEEQEYGSYLYDGYGFSGDEGDRVAITMESTAFDPIVRIGTVEANVFTELASNDDSPAGGGLNSYLVFSLPADGDYVIRASPLGGTEEGAYTLSLAEGPPPVLVRPIRVGDTVRGRLEDGDGSNIGGQRADGYSFRGQAGQRLVANVSSDDFDTYVELYTGEGDGRYMIDSDDDGAGDGTNSRLAYTLNDDSEYTLEVRAFSEDGEGDYSISLTEAAPEPAPTPLAFGATVQGEIVDADPRDSENRGFDAYRVTGTAGNRIQVILRSGDFDTFVQIGNSEGEFYPFTSDDDGLGEGTDSRLNYILPADGDYILRASPLYADADGLYSLQLIDRGPQPTAGSILVGGTARGTLSEDDAIAEDGSYYDAYRISAKEGDKLRLTMVSNEFDAFIDIGREGEDGLFSSVVSDDDSLSDTHAKVDWSVEEDGDYIIRARSFAQGQSGSYALTVEPKE